MRRIILITTMWIASIPTWLVVPAAAAPPESEVVQVDVSGVDRVTCPFRIRFTFTGTALVTNRYDDAGTLVSQRVHVNLIEVDTNVKTGTSLTSRQNETDFFNAETGVWRYTGLAFQFIVPGSGSVLTDAGLIVWTADGQVDFVAGPHQYLEGDVEDYCEALA